MGISNLVELATFCAKRFENSISGENARYNGTEFFAVTENNEVLYSTNPDILQNATQCMMIHDRYEKAYIHWYSWYKFEYIDTNGHIHDSCFDDDFSIWNGCWGQYDKQVMELKYEDTPYYWCERPWEKQIPIIWKMYCQLKEAKTAKERSLIVEVIKQNEQIIELKKEIEDYEKRCQKLEQCKSTLFKLKELIDPTVKEFIPSFF